MRGPGDNRAKQGTAMSGLKAGASSVGSAVSSTVGDGAAAVQSAAASAAAHLRDGATGAASQVAEGVKAVGETVSDYAGALKEKAGEQSGRARQQATLFGRELNAKTAALFEEQPLLVAAGGLAIGAFIAAMLPRTRLEDTYLGDTSDAVKEAVGHVASEQYREAKEAAGQVVERIKDEAINEDLSGTARAAVRDIGDKLKTVAEAANETIDQEAGKIVRRNIGVIWWKYQHQTVSKVGIAIKNTTPSRLFRNGARLLLFAAAVAVLALRDRSPTLRATERAVGSQPASQEPLRLQELRAAEPMRGRTATAPWHIPWLGWKDILWRTYQQIDEDRVLAVAAGCAKAL